MVARLLWEQDAAGSNPVSPMPQRPVDDWNLSRQPRAVFYCQKEGVSKRASSQNRPMVDVHVLFRREGPALPLITLSNFGLKSARPALDGKLNHQLGGLENSEVYGRNRLFWPMSMHQAQTALIQRGLKRRTNTRTVPKKPIPRTTAGAGPTQTQIRATTTPIAINRRNCPRVIGSLSPILIAMT